MAVRGPFVANAFMQPKQYFGLSTEDKPTHGVKGLDRFIETDTKNQYIFDGIHWFLEIVGG